MPAAAAADNISLFRARRKCEHHAKRVGGRKVTYPRSRGIQRSDSLRYVLLSRLYGPRDLRYLATIPKRRQVSDEDTGIRQTYCQSSGLASTNET